MLQVNNCFRKKRQEAIFLREETQLRLAMFTINKQKNRFSILYCVCAKWAKLLCKIGQISFS